MLQFGTWMTELCIIKPNRRNRMKLAEALSIRADLLEKKSRSINDEDVEVRRSKLLRFAASRGFETELVFRILKEIES